MNEPISRQLQLQDVSEFNDLLLHLSDAGLPIELDLEKVDLPLTVGLDRIVTRLALQTARGEALEPLLVEDPEIPIQYGNTLLAWFQSEKSIPSLAPLVRVARWHREADGQLTHALLQPLTLSMLAYGGFVYIALWLTPKMVSLHAEMDLEPGLGLKLLKMLESTFPYWGPAVPICILLLVVSWNRNHRFRSQGIFFRAKERQALRNANLAENLANCISEYTTADQALAQMKLRARDLGSEGELPPLIRTAVSPTLRSAEQRQALMDAREIYRESARLTLERWASWLPNIVGVLIGGVIVLMTGLCLFVPMCELLTAITKP